MHGFDEFFGNLYHLNAEEEPENVDYPKDPEFRKKFGPRGVLHTWANGDGTQRIEDTGPLTKKRMETVRRRIPRCGNRFHQAPARGRDTVLRLVQLHPHALPHPSQAGEHRQGRPVAVGVPRHDAGPRRHRRRAADPLDELGIADNTIVMYSTDNGPHMNSWPDAGMTPFRNEKNSNWEGAYRVPAMVRWPGHIRPGTVLNGIVSHNDWFVTLLAAAGDTDIAERLRAGTDLNGTNFKVHLDGHNQLRLHHRRSRREPAQALLLRLRRRRPHRAAVRQLEDRLHGAASHRHAADLARAYTVLRAPKLFNLRTDPYERADITSNTYYDWVIDRIFVFAPAQLYAAQMMPTLVEFPPGRSLRASTSTR